MRTHCPRISITHTYYQIWYMILHGTEHIILPIVCCCLPLLSLLVSLLLSPLLVIALYPFNLHRCALWVDFIVQFIYEGKKKAQHFAYTNILIGSKLSSSSESQVFYIRIYTCESWLDSFLLSLPCALRSRNTRQVFQPNNAHCWTTIKHNECKRTPANNSKAYGHY